MVSSIKTCKTRSGIYVHDYELGTCHTKTLFYIDISMGKLKTNEFCNLSNKYMAFEFFVKIKKRNLSTGLENNICKESIHPINYCTPFENNKLCVYFNVSVENIVNYINENELTFDLCFVKSSGTIGLISEKINGIINPFNDVNKVYNICSPENDFKTCVNLKLKWSTIASKKNKIHWANINFKKNENEGFGDSLDSSPNLITKPSHESVLDLPEQLYFVYEDTLFSDPFTSSIANLKIKKKDAIISTSEELSPTIISKIETQPGKHYKLGGWKIKMASISLKEEGFICVYDKFPKYDSSKSFRVFFQYCIKDENGENITPYRGSWSILTLKKMRNNVLTASNVSLNKLYSSNLNIYSRIPEIISDDLLEKYFFVRCIVPSVCEINSKERTDYSNILFSGSLYPDQIVDRRAIIKLYKGNALETFVGYIHMELRDICEENIPQMNNINKTPEIQKLCDFERINVNDIIDELSLLFVYIYWHIKMRSRVENKDPMDILQELYFRLSSLTKCDYLNKTSISKCIEAFVPLDHCFLGRLTCLVKRIDDATIIIKNIDEFYNLLFFPHLTLLKKSYKDIFSGRNSLEYIQFIRICSSIGVRESFATTWFEMMRNSDDTVNIKSYVYCINNYIVKNIFKKVTH